MISSARVLTSNFIIFAWRNKVNVVVRDELAMHVEGRFTFYVFTIRTKKKNER